MSMNNVGTLPDISSSRFPILVHCFTVCSVSSNNNAVRVV